MCVELPIYNINGINNVILWYKKKKKKVQQSGVVFYNLTKLYFKSKIVILVIVFIL